MRCAARLLTAALALSAAGPLQITTTGVPTAAVSSTPFSYTWTATGGTTPYRWSIAAGTLPPGLSFSSAGLLSGTPTSLGTFGFTVHVADTGNLSADFATKMTITAPPLTITSAPITSGTLNFPVTLPFTGTGGVPPYSWKLSAGTLPPGLFLTPTALLSGVWTTPGTYNFTFTLTDSAGSTATQTESVTVATATVLPAGVVGNAYSASTSAGATLAPGTIGGPPPGVLVTSNGLAGIPTTAGTYVFSVGSTTYSISATAPLASIKASLPDGQIGLPYSSFLPVNGGTAPYKWTLAGGSLPAGLSLAGSGQITGTPTATGTATFTANVTDSTGAIAPSSFSVRVDGSALQVQLPSNVYSAATGVPFTTALSASGGTPPYTWAATELPPGVILYGELLVGTPSAFGFYNVTARVTDASGTSASGIVQVFVANPTPLPDGLVGSPYSVPLSSGPSCSLYPPGLAVQNQVLSGTPYAPGIYYLPCLTAAFPTSCDSICLAISGGSFYTLHILGSSTPRLDSITNSGSYVLNQIAPGEIVALYGADLGPPVLSGTQLSADGKFFASTNAGTMVKFDGNPVPLVYSLESQVAAIAPFGLKPGATTTITVEFNGVASNALTVPVVAAQPGVFTLSGSGTGVAAAVNPDGAINSQTSPAAQGSTLLLYLTGTGQMSPAGVDGLIATAASSTLATPTAYINGAPARIIYAGNAPTLVEGATQINLQLPSSVSPGAAQLLLFFGNAEAQQAVTLWVK